jgi:hypothetical protein
MRGEFPRRSPLVIRASAVHGDAVSLDVRAAKFGDELGSFSVSDTGTLIALASRATNPRLVSLVWIDRTGKTRAGDPEDEFSMGSG